MWKSTKIKPLLSNDKLTCKQFKFTNTGLFCINPLVIYWAKCSILSERWKYNFVYNNFNLKKIGNQLKDVNWY